MSGEAVVVILGVGLLIDFGFMPAKVRREFRWPCMAGIALGVVLVLVGVGMWLRGAM